MIARMLVGSSSSPVRRALGRGLASSSMKSGLPSAVRRRSSREGQGSRPPGEELGRRARELRRRRAARGGPPCRRGGHLPSPAARRAAPGGRARERAPARPGRERRTSRSGRGGCCPPSGCPRTGALSARPRERLDEHARREEEGARGRRPRRPRRADEHGEMSACSSAAAGPASEAIAVVELLRRLGGSSLSNMRATCFTC